MVGVLSVVGLIWEVTSDTVSARETREQAPYSDITVSVVPASAMTWTATESWGTVEFKPATVVLEEETRAAGVEQAAGTTHTDITDSAVTIVDAAVNVDLPTGADDVSYQIERAIAVDGVTHDWFVIASAATATDFSDDDVIYKGSYQYRVTPQGDSVENPTPTVSTYEAPARQIFAGRWENNQIVLEIRPNPLQPAEFQYVTIKEFDHVEMDQSHETTVTIASRRQLSDGVTQIAFTPAWDDGDIRSYAMSLYYKRGPNARFEQASLRVAPVAIRKGDVEPDKPGEPDVLVNEDGTLQVLWDENNDARKAVGYEVQRRPLLRPIQNNAFESVVVTTKNTVQVPKSSAEGTVDEFRIRPLKVNITPGTTVSEIAGKEQQPRPLCLTPVILENPIRMEVLYLFPDLTQPWGQGTPLTFDVLAIDGFQRPCALLDASDFYLQRMFYYKHMLDPSCPDPALSCTVMNKPVDRQPGGVAVYSGWLYGVKGGEVENLYDTHAVIWGSGDWRAVGFTDHDYQPGRYGALYRVCTVGVEFCSHWLDAPIANVGVGVIPFKRGDYLVDFETREFIPGDGLTTFGTWPNRP